MQRFFQLGHHLLYLLPSLFGVLVLLCLPATHLHAAWRSYSHDKITLVSDLPQSKARRLLQQLVWFDPVVDHYTVPRTESAPPLRVLVFKDRDDFEKIFKQQHFAAFTQPELARTTLVVGPEQVDDALQNTLHEYVHYRLRTQDRSYPMWYEEGLATILSTTQFDRDGDQVVRTTSHRLPAKFANVSFSKIALPALVETTSFDRWPHRKVGGFYKRSAQLTRFLLHAEHIDKVELSRALQAHLSDRSTSLFDKLQHTPAQLEQLMRQFAKTPGKPLLTVTSSVADIDPVVTELTRDDSRLILIQTALSANPRYAARGIRRLLKKHPEDAHLWATLAAAERQFNPRRSAASLQQAISVNPHHPEVLLQTALRELAACPLDRSLNCLNNWQDVTSILRQVLEHNPNHHQAIMWLGVTELYSGNPGGALNYLTIAYHRAPWAPRVNYLLGEAMRLLGNPRARHYLERARYWAYDEQLRKFAEASLNLLPDVRISGLPTNF